MHAATAFLSPRSLGRALVLLTVGLAAANCSSDTARFNDNPFASGSVPPGQVPTGQVDARPLATPPVSSQPLPPPEVRSPGTYGNAVPGGNPGMGSYQPAVYTPEVTGAVPQLNRQAPANRTWDWAGGTAVTVAPGDSLFSLAQRYHVPAQAIAEANGLHGPAVLRPGQHLVIPRVNALAAPGPRVAAPIATPQAAPAATRAPLSSVHVVSPGETLLGIAKRYHVSIVKLAKANKIAPYTRVKMGDRLVIPGKRRMRTAAATPAVQPRRAPVSAPTRVRAPTRVTRKPAPVKQAIAPVRKSAPVKHTAEARPRVEPVKPTQIARNETTSSIHRVAPVEDAAVADNGSSKTDAPSFRWPVRGRVITSFGTKVNGQRNDGIDLAVPEGTSVRAADDGVVAYAGNELKGYGNLILVRHSNGFVTAYAHASKIMVKRNEKVRRGQVIAKSGQSGNVSAPQLHFEIRKGSSPIDPMQQLPRA